MNMHFNVIEENFFEDEGLNWIVVEKGIERKVMAYNEDMMMVKVRFEAGARGSLHKHTHTQITFIESGVFEVVIESKKKILRKGDVFYVPSNIIHGVESLAEGILIDVFNPVREDFL
jgi:quercetin dioxygenase-like cupin family protein